MDNKQSDNVKALTQIWVTRWALTQGIKAVTAELSNDHIMASYKVDSYYVYVHGNDFHLTEGAAKARANEMVEKKIASLEKNMAKLKKLTF